MNEKAVKKEFVLQVLDGDSFRPITREEFSELSKEIPDLGQLLDEEDSTFSEKSQVPEIDESTPIYYHWEKAAVRMMAALGRNHYAMFFNEPVNPEKLGIHDYFDIIKRPMDFGTIKEKLKRHEYLTMRQFLEDVELVFENCLIYNGEDPRLARAGRDCRGGQSKQWEGGRGVG